MSGLPHIITRGSAWYSSLYLSNPKSTGTKLISVCGHVQRPGTYEITLGLPMRELIYDICGGMLPGRTLKAVIPGGSSTPVIPKSVADNQIMDFDSLKDSQTGLGTAAGIVMDKSTDIVRAISRLSTFYKHESCGQCTP